MGQLMAMSAAAPHPFVRIAEDDGSWSLQYGGLWVASANGNFTLTSDQAARERFRFIKASGSESAVATLEPGEVALYELPNYRGRVFVLDQDDIIPPLSGATAMPV